jgi:hypothetical protein
MSMLDLKHATGPTPIVNYDATGKVVPPWPSPVELRKLPSVVQERILTASAELAEDEYRTNKDLTDFEAFAEEP